MANRVTKQLIIGSLVSLLAYFPSTGLASHAAPGHHFEFKAYKAQYRLKKAGFTLGKAEFSLQPSDNDQWNYTSKVTPKGFARMFTSEDINISATISFADKTVTPLGYRMEGKGKKKEVVNVAYNWAQKTAQLTHNDKISDVQLSTDHQDPYSMILSLIQATALGQSEVAYQVIDKSLKLRSFRQDGEETVKTPLGKKRAIRIIQSDGNKRQMRFWLCPELNYIPVRIERLKKGKRQVTMTLDKLDWTSN